MLKAKFYQSLTRYCAHLICLLPFVFLCAAAWNNQLGANPVEMLHTTLGEWALRFLCLTLTITPLRKFLKINGIHSYRRMLGLYAFFYASMHLLVFIALDVNFSWTFFLEEFKEGPFIIFGIVTYLILLPLTATSTLSMQRKMGRRWKALHKLIYLAAITAILHYFLLVKSDLLKPVIYAAYIILLFSFRLQMRIIKNRQPV